jgi:pyruvyl transferase EpsI
MFSFMPNLTDILRDLRKSTPHFRKLAPVSASLKSIKWVNRRFSYFLLMLNLIKTKNKQRYFYLMGSCPTMGNVGDQAQSAVTPIWILKHFGGPLIQINAIDIYNEIDLVTKYINQNDVIFIQSGSTFGDDWYETHHARESIIERFGDHKIVQLPQTIHYSNTERGRECLVKSQRIIGNAKSFFLIARDPESARFAHEHFGTATIATYPDIVLSLQDIAAQNIQRNATASSGTQKKCLLVFRADREGKLKQDEKDQLISQVQAAGYHVDLWDTLVNDYFPEKKKLQVIMSYLKYIASYDAIVTDRYHAFIFALLVNCPCVVLPTHNHKITSGFIPWFSKVNFVKMLNEGDDVCESLKAVLNVKVPSGPDWNKEFFDPMAQEIRHFISDSPA